MRLLLICVMLFSSAPLYPQQHTNPRARWFTNARFGMFIHWGVYSGAEGIWKGEKHRDDNNYAEWILYRNRIDRDEYLTLLERFDWKSIDPEEWVLLAKNSGMKYVTITAKHHDGFGLWDSQVSDYDVGNYTDPKRDIIKELAAACLKHGLKLGLYYSHWVDWEHEFGWDHTKEVYTITAEQYDQYWQEKVMPQVRELLTHYGDIGLMWFDMWKHHSETIVTKEQLLQLKTMIRELQPDCLVNSRMGLSVEEDSDIDFRTLGDNQIGSLKLEYPWQSPATVADSWGFHTLDSDYKSTTTLLKFLINNVSLNGNFMLNIGPRANGELPAEVSQRMLAMGDWLAVNGESIYGAGGFDLRKDLHDWGWMTGKFSDEKNQLFLHVFTWPLNKQLCLTGVKSAPSRVYVLADKHKAPLRFQHTDMLTTIQLPPAQPDPFVSVVVVEYPQRPQVVAGLVAQTTDGGFSLTPKNQHPPEKNLSLVEKQRRGTIPEHIVVDKEKTLSWTLFIDEPGEMIADISYSFQGESGENQVALTLNGQTLTHTIRPTGVTVGEPNANWVIDNFKCMRLGSVTIAEKGEYTVQLDISTARREAVKFQWVWLK